MDLLAFTEEFQRVIDNGAIIPGWHTNTSFMQGLVAHISADGLSSIYPPGSLTLDPRSPDLNFWLPSHQEEFNGLVSNDAYTLISSANYFRLSERTGCTAFPSMVLFTVKKESYGLPCRAK